MPCCQPSSYQRITSGTHLKAQVDFSSRCLQHNGKFCTPAEPNQYVKAIETIYRESPLSTVPGLVRFQIVLNSTNSPV